jgi:cation transport regulator
MPYKTNKDLPDSVTNHTPPHAQDIYREAFNHAHEEYKSSSKRKGGAGLEETAHKVAWAAVKKKYKKGEDGNWHSK